MNNFSNPFSRRSFLAGGSSPDKAAAIKGGHNFAFEVTPPPPILQAVKDVAALPLALSGFLAVLAVGAVGHALSIAVRRRRHELAVLRALGLTRRQSRQVIITLRASVGIRSAD